MFGLEGEGVDVEVADDLPLHVHPRAVGALAVQRTWKRAWENGEFAEEKFV